MQRRFEIRKQQLLADCEVSPKVFAKVTNRLDEFAGPFVKSFWRPEQRQHAQRYLEGLMSDLDQKNSESIAYRHDEDRQGLQHFMGSSLWDHRPLIQELVRQIAAEVGEADGVIVFDPSGFPKQGRNSVGVKPARENDVRFTRIGKVLRATALDELPQLINILKGDMSFVGPRALAVGELDASFPGFAERHEGRPGLTGSAQIDASRDAALKEKFRYDLDYIRNRTFWGDLRLIFLSVWITLRGRWESRDKKL